MNQEFIKLKEFTIYKFLNKVLNKSYKLLDQNRS